MSLAQPSLPSNELRQRIPLHSCSEWYQTFELNADLEIHLESHHKPKSFGWDFCNKECHLLQQPTFLSFTKAKTAVWTYDRNMYTLINFNVCFYCGLGFTPDLPNTIFKILHMPCLSWKIEAGDCGHRFRDKYVQQCAVILEIIFYLLACLGFCSFSLFFFLILP